MNEVIEDIRKLLGLRNDLSISDETFVGGKK
jgi:hypothetical protein